MNTAATCNKMNEVENVNELEKKMLEVIDHYLFSGAKAKIPYSD